MTIHECEYRAHLENEVMPALVRMSKERDEARAEVERLMAERMQFAEDVASKAMRHFISMASPNEPYGAADWSRGEYCIKTALAEACKEEDK